MTGQLVGYPRNTTVYCFVLLHKHMHAKTFLISMKSKQFMNGIKNKEIYNIHQQYMYIMELYFTYYQCNETVTQLVLTAKPMSMSFSSTLYSMSFVSYSSNKFSLVIFSKVLPCEGKIPDPFFCFLHQFSSARFPS